MSQKNPYKIPFNRPTIIGKELYYISQTISNGHAAGDGEFTKKCNRLLEQSLGVPKVLLTTSCTHALEMAALLLDIQPGDEVIVQANTYIASVMGITINDATPVNPFLVGETVGFQGVGVDWDSGLPSNPQTYLTPVARIKEFYQVMVNAMDVGILAVNTSGMTILANRAARESFGNLSKRPVSFEPWKRQKLIASLLARARNGDHRRKRRIACFW